MRSLMLIAVLALQGEAVRWDQVHNSVMENIVNLLDAKEYSALRQTSVSAAQDCEPVRLHELDRFRCISAAEATNAADPFAPLESLVNQLALAESKQLGALGVPLERTARGVVPGIPVRLMDQINPIVHDETLVLINDFAPFVAGDLIANGRIVLKAARRYLAQVPIDTIRNNAEFRQRFLCAVDNALFGNVPLRDRVSRLTCLSSFLKKLQQLPYRAQKIMKHAMEWHALAAYVAFDQPILPTVSYKRSFTIEILYYDATAQEFTTKTMHVRDIPWLMDPGWGFDRNIKARKKFLSFDNWITDMERFLMTVENAADEPLSRFI